MKEQGDTVLLAFNKRRYMCNKTVVTHNGKFHADDVFSIATLQLVYSDLTLIRTRDAQQIADADIVVDVGHEYDAARGRFDHHQRGGAGARDNGIPYSSFGLVWQEYGPSLCQHDQAVVNAVDAQLVSVIDAIDCGYILKGESGVSLSKTISLFNPTWQEPSEFDACFNEAVAFAQRILLRFIASVSSEIYAEQQVQEAILQAEDPQLIVLESYIPWQKTVHRHAPQALYVVYPSATGSQWMIQAVPTEPGAFSERKALPATWAGLDNEALQQLTGVSDAVFCHNGLFIAGAVSFTGIKQLAALALQSV